MENVINKIGKEAVKTYQNAAKATGKIAKELKLKSLMSENKSKIQELYEDIGKRVYEKYILKEEILIEKDLMNDCSMIDILADEVEDVRMELLKLKDQKQCPNCHYEIYFDFHYCPNCGSIQEQKESDMSSNSTATIVTTDAEDRYLKQEKDEIEIDEDNEDIIIQSEENDDE